MNPDWMMGGGPYGIARCAGNRAEDNDLSPQKSDTMKKEFDMMDMWNGLRNILQFEENIP